MFLFTLFVFVSKPVQYIVYCTGPDWQRYYIEQTKGSVGRACLTHLSFYFEETLYRTFHRCFLPNFGSYGYSVSEKIF